MGKKSKKKDAKPDNTAKKFIPVPTHWPGKISNENLFAAFAREMREDSNDKDQFKFVCLRIKQIGWSFHDFFITLPKSATIMQLQNEIAKIQHVGSVAPEKIIIYKHLKSPSPNPSSNNVSTININGSTNTVSQKQPNAAQSTEEQSADANALQIDEKLFCDDPKQQLREAFAEIDKFVLEEENRSTKLKDVVLDAIDQSTDALAEPKSKSRPSSSKKKARSAKSPKSRPTSAASSNNDKEPPKTHIALGETSVKFIHDIVAREKSRVKSVARPLSRKMSMTNANSSTTAKSGQQTSLSKQPSIIKLGASTPLKQSTTDVKTRPRLSSMSKGKLNPFQAPVQQPLPSHVTIYYDIQTYKTHNLLPENSKPHPLDSLDLLDRLHVMEDTKLYAAMDIDCSLLMREGREWVSRLPPEKPKEPEKIFAEIGFHGMMNTLKFARKISTKINDRRASVDHGNLAPIKKILSAQTLAVPNVNDASNNDNIGDALNSTISGISSSLRATIKT